MDSKRFPVVSKELLEELERRFPDKINAYQVTDFAQYQFIAGTVHVIDFLRAKFKEQNNNVLEN